MKKIHILLLLSVVLFASFRVDEAIVLAIPKLRPVWLDPFVMWFTDNAPVAAAALLILSLLLKGKRGKSVLIMICFAMALEADYMLKLFFDIPRPYQSFEIQSLTQSGYSSFPSMHAAFAFAALPLLVGTKRKYFFSWLAFSVLLALSRVYVGVHFASDVIAGSMVGLSIGFAASLIEEKHKMVERCLIQIHNRFELRRQTAHALTGIAIIVLVKLGYLNVPILAMVLILGGIASFILKKKKIPLLCGILDYFERRRDIATFPGKGAFFLVFGSLIALHFFPMNVAFASIIIMSVGDSITNIFGTYFGKIPNPFNKKKNIEGTLAATIASALAANFFIPFFPALAASAVAMFIESLDLKVGDKEIDDNILIPLIAGWIITRMM